MLKIVICEDVQLWHEKFAHALDKKIAAGLPLQYAVVNIDRHDWVEKIIDADAVIWKPAYMYPRFAGYFKEKIYFMEKILGKLIFPNFDTIWHFDSKIAQKFFFDHYGIPTPRTFASFDYRDAIEVLGNYQLPVVYKESHGASSEHVRLIKTVALAKRYINRIFIENRWRELKKGRNKIITVIRSFFYNVFWHKLLQKMLHKEPFGAIYWQELIPDNDADLRIDIIGDRYAFGFWRNNRCNDFRASGSGRIDFQRQLPLEIMKYCFQINKNHNFDSMAYDIIFKNKQFVITEMSYGYNDKAVYDCGGYYVLTPKDEIIYHAGHTWPQEIWIEWLIDRLQMRFPSIFEKKS
jgi:glutathione synthase/RimK-type ligase-like ATP-grasp enzyme